MMAVGTADSAESILPWGCSFLQIIMLSGKMMLSFCVQRHHRVSGPVHVLKTREQ